MLHDVTSLVCLNVFYLLLHPRILGKFVVASFQSPQHVTFSYLASLYACFLRLTTWIFSKLATDSQTCSCTFPSGTILE